jgi:hypothetical protein
MGMNICKFFKVILNKIGESNAAQIEPLEYCYRPESEYSLAEIQKTKVRLLCQGNELSKVCPFK